MKICVVSEHEYAIGAAIAAFRLARSLSDAGHEVSYLFAFPFRDGALEYRKLRRVHLGRIQRGREWLFRCLELDAAVAKRAPWARAAWNGAARRLERRLYAQHRYELLRALDALRPDVVNLHNVSALLRHDGVEALAERAPVCWSLHDEFAFRLYHNRWTPLDETTPVASHGRFVDRAAAEAARDRLLVRAGEQPQRLCFVTPSAWLRERAREALPASARVRLIPNGLSPHEFHPEDPQRARRELELDPRACQLLFLSARLDDPLKNFALVARALERLGRSDARVLAVGRASPELARRYPRVRFLPASYACADLRRYYAAADLLLVPSLVENFPNTILEAAFCATPAAAARVGGIPELVVPGRTGWLFDPRDPAALARILDAACGGRAELAEAGREACRRAGARFDAGDQRDAHLELFAELGRG